MKENTKESIIDDIVSDRIKDFLLSSFRVIDLIESEDLGLVFNFDRDLLLIISELVSEGRETEFLLIEGPDPDEDFKTRILVM